MYIYYKMDPIVLDEYVEKKRRCSSPRLRLFLPALKEHALPGDYISRAAIAYVIRQNPWAYPLDEMRLSQYISSAITSFKRLGVFTADYPFHLLMDDINQVESAKKRFMAALDDNEMGEFMSKRFDDKGNQLPPYIYWDGRSRKYEARAYLDGEERKLGYFSNLKNALKKQTRFMEENTAQTNS